jgi:O-antigen/teichoic acid export membrane protein
VFWRALSTAAAFLLNILFARYYTASASGEVLYLFTLFAFVIQIVSFSLESGIGYYAAKNNMDDRQLIGFSIAWSFLSAGIAVALFVQVAVLFSLPVNYPLYYPAVYISGNMLVSFGNAYCYSRYRFVLPGIISLLINVLLIILLLSAEYSGWKTYFVPVYFSSFLLYGICLFAWIIFGFRVFPAFVFSSGNLRNIFRYSMQAFAGNILFLLMNRVDYFFVKKYCLPADLGNYIQVSKIAQLFFLLPSLIATVLFPVIAGGLKNAIASRVRIISVLILIGYSGLLLILLITGPWLFPWLYGKSFGNMYLPFVLLIPGILAISSLYPYTTYYSGVNRLRVNVIGAAIALIFIIAGDMVFIPEYGIRAAALVSSGGYILFHFYITLIFRREFDLSFKKLFLLNREEYLYIIRGLNGKHAG